MNDFLANVMTPYNQRNNPDFPLVSYIDGTGAIRKAIASSYLGREPGHDGGAYYFVKLTDTETGLVINDRYGWGFPLPGLSYGFEGNITSQYDPNNLVALPSQLAGLAPITDIEIAKDSTGGASTGTVRNAVIQAGGKVNITATQDLINSVIHEDYALSGSASKVEDTQIGAGPRVQVRINAQLPPDLAQQQVNPTTLPGFSLPTGQNGLFRLSGQDSSTGSTGPPSWTLGGASLLTGQHQNAGASVARVQGVPITSGGSHPQKYLIETNPVLTDLKQFMSSDYLLGKLGYDPDDSARRLGDGLYEQRLIQQAIVARTGQRFMDGMTSDEAQFRYLMDNAIASKDALSLSVGISLTAEQVAALTHDIVWLESEEIDGQTVLVPVLYLANANNRLAPNGALIQGSDVTLIAGNDLNNGGTLKATGNLSAAAGNNLVNSGLVNAGGRLDLLAGNDLTNKAGGIIAGRDVSVTSLNGDVINERTVTGYDNSNGSSSLHRDFVDSAARIEAANDLAISAGRDFNNSGGVLQSGRDLSIGAGRDVNITSAAQVISNDHGVDLNDSSIKHYGAEVTAGQNLSIQAGRDLTVIGSQLNADGNAALDAGNNLTLASSADEQHSYSKTKRVTKQEDHVHQNGSGVKVGGNVTLNAGNNLTLISSNVEAGGEAYLSAGNQLALLAAQDSDYTLYDMQKKAGFGGNGKTQRDEVTDVKNIGSQIKTGGDLTLVSGGNQHYQNAKLDSGGDLTLDSGGSITFEAVKDSHQESHDKSSSSAAWTSMESKGQVDETLRQSQLAAKGQILIHAVDGLHIDVKDINQQNVSQAIDAMVQADPSLAWLKDAEARNDVDWRQVQELHDSWDESHSGLGAPAMLIIIIIVTYFTAGLASGALGSAAGATAGSTSAMSAGLAATATEGAVAAGWANAALTAIITSAASTAAVSTINNKGNIGAALEETFSIDNLKNYIVAGGTAGLTAGFFNDWTSTTTGTAPPLTDSTSGALSNTGKVVVADPGGLSSLQGIGHFTENQLLQNSTSALLNKALGRDGSLGDALQNSLVNAFTAYGFNLVGDTGLPNGEPAKIALHALMGGLASIAAGGNFNTGALAAGVNEALVGDLASAYAGMSKEDRDRLLLMNSQLIGVLTTAVQDPNADIDKLQLGASIAQSGTQYNFLNHQDVKDLEKALNDCQPKGNCDAVRAEFALRDAANTARLNNCGATDNCAQIRAEIDEGSHALSALDQSDDSGIAADFLHKNTSDWLNANSRTAIDHLPQGDPANAVKALAAAGLIVLGPEAIALLAGLAEAGATTCAANPVLCANEVGIWIGELGMSEALPVGLGAAAGGLTAKELSDLRGLMEIETKTGAKLTADEIAAVVRPTASGAKGVSPVVTAEGKIGDTAFTDVNQTARPIAQANPDEPTLIADRVATKIEATGKPLPNGNMADAHAEIGVIQQAYDAGKTQGADMAMSVAGKDVCGFCKGDIAAAAEKAGLNSLTVQAIDDVTGLPKTYNWVPGMRSIKEVP
jgi:filamentous hemagglutinin